MNAETPTALASTTVLTEQAVGRLCEALSLLEAIDAGGFLDELPNAAESARNHQCAVSLLAILRRELRGLVCELQSACLVHDVMARVGRPGPAE